MRKLTVTLRQDVLDRLRVLAAERRQSVNRYVGDLLTELAYEPASDWQAKQDELHVRIGHRHRTVIWNREGVYAERLQ